MADGEIAATFDEVPSNVPSPDQRAVPITLRTVGGNWVALKMDDGHYGMYAHLIPGSLTVKPGDRVKKGDVLGRIGNTGNSTAPHLHFHVSSTPNWIASVGRPYRLERYLVVGSVKDDPLNDFVFEARPGAERTGDLLAEDEVIEISPLR